MSAQEGGPGDLATLVADLHGRGLNYSPEQAPPHVVAGWHQDDVRVLLGREEPGEIIEGGLARRAEALVNSYEFADPSILRAVYHYPADLIGRDMLLTGRFLILQFVMGVRITEAVDEVRDGEHRLGYAYETLEGHLEQGKLYYEIVKDLATGQVEFRIIAYSRRAPLRNPFVALGFRFFARHTQLRFYTNALARLARLIAHPSPALPQQHADGLVRAPEGKSPWPVHRFTIRMVHPGR